MDYCEIETKLNNIFELVKEEYPNKFNNVKLIISIDEFERSRYSYKYTGKNVSNPTITVCAEEYNIYDDFQTNYYNETFGTKLKHNYETVLIRMLLHECGHHFNINYYKDRDEEYMEQLNKLEELELDSYERKYAYRQIDEEYDADKFASIFLKKYLNKCLDIMKAEIAY